MKKIERIWPRDVTTRDPVPQVCGIASQKKVKSVSTQGRTSLLRRGPLPLAGAALLAAVAAGASCSNDESSPGPGGQTTGGQGNGTGGVTGGSPNSGTGGGAPLRCKDVSPCGGDVVGTWQVKSSCLEFAGDTDVALTSLGCKTVQLTGSLETTGTLITKADGTFTDNTRTTGSATVHLPAACLSISSVPVTCDRVGSIFETLGWSKGTCTVAGSGCDCKLDADHEKGALGTLAPFEVESGTYATSGSALTLDTLEYSYCTSGNSLTLTPKLSGLHGTVTLEKGSASGAGGAAGAGGAPTGGTTAGGTPNGGTSGAATGGKANGGAGGATGGAPSGGSGGAVGGFGGAGGGPGGGTKPCDIYAAANNQCVAAHSTVRALFGAYAGNLYQVKRASDGMTKDIPVLSPGGYADAAQQDMFCTGTTCTIMRVYDQSGKGNFIEAQTPDSTVGGFKGQTAAKADADPFTINGHKAYSLFTRPSQAYWRDGSKSGMPLGAAPQGVYMVTSGKHFNNGCCYNYGTAQLSRTYEGGPTMDSVYFGNCTIWGSGAGQGPWVMADMEDGIVSGRDTSKNQSLESLPFTFVTAMEKNNGTTEFAIKGADATTPTLKTFYQGSLPAGKNPMKKQGAVVLGSGGDCCYSNNNASEGTFYEGAIVTGYPSDATDNAIHANIVEAGYGE
jgi:hypothetical protein